jgi:hypothetical protein
MPRIVQARNLRRKLWSGRPEIHLAFHGAAAYQTWGIASVFGGDVLKPDVRHLIAECPRKDAPDAACGVYYADLREWSM